MFSVIIKRKYLPFPRCTHMELKQHANNVDIKSNVSNCFDIMFPRFYFMATFFTFDLFHEIKTKTCTIDTVTRFPPLQWH